MYRGEFLPELAGEEWVAIESCKYQKLYVDCINEASALLRERQEYEELLELSAQACGIYFFEEYYLMQRAGRDRAVSGDEFQPVCARWT